MCSDIYSPTLELSRLSAGRICYKYFLPEQIGKEVAVDTGELATMLDRMEELKPIVIVKGREKILAGNYFITGKYITRKSYDVPADLKAQFEKVTQYWKTTIKRLAA